ncbi:diguanylate cyclase [Idiomarina sp. HP20-50]|uniref:GGDEF domain-containing protein n=1 Tax=Idiomarina sp. HP20-50 TaxID=3070813 RepID=UPI00294AD952|nr:diguanylate cyclase [Idiomarina sp. HP20-50]MDV6314859.1 diguanylate cyclase [Idiomarina sp. HP20-50]
MSQYLFRSLLLTISWVVLWRVAAIMEYGPHASIWFPPAGLTFAALLVMRWKAIPALLLAGVLSTLWVTGLYGNEIVVREAVTTGLIFGVAHCTPYFIGAWLLRSKLTRLGSHGLASTIMAFLGIAAASSLFAAWFGTEVMAARGMLEADAVWYTWLPWWIGDMSGIIVLSPLFIGLMSWRYPELEHWLGGLSFTVKTGSQSSFVWKILLILVLLALCLILTVTADKDEAAFSIFFLILPLLWVSYTESPLNTAIALALFSTTTALAVGLLGLMDYAIVYQFAVTVIAASVWFGLTVPTLIAHNQLLTRQVSEDGLTRTASREHFMQRADALIKLSKRQNKPLSLIMFDVDDFKKINDSYGHIAGDQALVQITNRVASALRNSDLLGRFGGDEFMILLPGSSVNYAEETAERLRVEISKTTLVGTEHYFSCSFGVAQVVANEHIMATIDRADKALLEAKRHGKNRIEKENSCVSYS